MTTTDRCDYSDLPREMCAHCGAAPGDRPQVERPWRWDGRGVRVGGRALESDPTAFDLPGRRIIKGESRCHYDAELGWLGAEHLRACKATDCKGCKPCGKTHCALRGRCPEHVNIEVGERTCPRCIDRARVDLLAIEQLYAVAMRDEVTYAGTDSEAFTLIGPVADRGQWEARRQRRVSADEARGWCDYPRHELLRPLDPYHPETVLGGWDIALRETYGPPTDLLTNVSRSVAYLTGLLAGPFPHGDEFEAFTAEIVTCRTHLEAVVHNSRAPETGRHCPRCIELRGKGPRLRKRYGAHPGLPPGHRCAAPIGKCKICDGRDDTWHCPDVGAHWWTEEDYRRHVASDYVEHADELPAAELADRLGVPLSTVRKWAARVWDDAARAYREPALKARRKSADGRKVYRVADALRLIENRSA